MIDPELRFLASDRQPTVDEAIVSYPICYALQSREPNDVIFLGDSACADGVDPSRFAFKSYNLGTLGRLGPRGYLTILLAYLKSHPQPRLVVLCLGPFVLQVVTTNETAERFVDNFGPEVSSVSPFCDGAAYFVRHGAQSIVRRSDRRDDPLEAKETETFRSFKTKIFAARGFYALPGEHGDFRDSLRGSKPIRDEWRKGIAELADACADRQIPLLVRFAPMFDERRKDLDAEEIDRWCRELQRVHGVRIAHPAVIAYQRDLMYDTTHLNHRGVERFTSQVSRDVQAALHALDKGPRNAPGE